MREEKPTKKVEPKEKNGLIAWIKEHRVQLIYAGLGITTLILTALGLKNKEAIKEMWDSLKSKIEKGAKYSARWFENASIDELQSAREIVRQDYINPSLDTGYRNECWNLLSRFDNAIGKKEWDGKPYSYPVHREHGWYLPNDD